MQFSPFFPLPLPNLLPIPLQHNRRRNIYQQQLVQPIPMFLKKSSFVKRDSENDININIKKSPISKLTDENIKYLKDNIGRLTDIYNIILKHLCDGRNDANNIIHGKILSDLDRDIENKFCIGNKVDSSCTNSLFNKTNLMNSIQKMKDDKFLKKACIYKTGDKYNIKIKLGGTYDINSNDDKFKLIDLNKIIYENTSTHNRNSVLCIQVNDKLKCANSEKKIQDRECKFCDIWTKERNLFRSVINDLVNANNMDNVLELIGESANLLPAVIMDQKQYHEFLSKIDEYKKAKKEGKF
jgi:hypothetical protein